jgi:hypothetical protein
MGMKADGVVVLSSSGPSALCHLGILFDLTYLNLTVFLSETVIT